MKLESYPSIEAFYSAHENARRSGESDYGVWWRDDDGGLWRVTYVHDTGHVYAIHLGGMTSGHLSVGGETAMVFSAGDGAEGPVVIIAQLEACGDIGFSTPAPAETALKGWAEICSEQGSLRWVFEQLAPIVPS